MSEVDHDCIMNEVYDGTASEADDDASSSEVLEDASASEVDGMSDADEDVNTSDVERQSADEHDLDSENSSTYTHRSFGDRRLVSLGSHILYCDINTYPEQATIYEEFINSNPVRSLCCCAIILSDRSSIKQGDQPTRRDFAIMLQMIQDQSQSTPSRHRNARRTRPQSGSDAEAPNFDIRRNNRDHLQLKVSDKTLVCRIVTEALMH